MRRPLCKNTVSTTLPPSLHPSASSSANATQLTVLRRHMFNASKRVRVLQPVVNIDCRVCVACVVACVVADAGPCLGGCVRACAGPCAHVQDYVL